MSLLPNHTPKRTLGWRTCLVIPELEVEMETARKNEILRIDDEKNHELRYGAMIRGC